MKNTFIALFFLMTWIILHITAAVQFPQALFMTIPLHIIYTKIPK